MPLQPTKLSPLNIPKKRGNSILWIASYPKSGNTWMRAFLANLINGEEKPLSLDDIGNYCPSEANLRWYRPFFGGKTIDDFSDKELVSMRPMVQQALLLQSKHNLPLKTHSQFGIVFKTPLIDIGLSIAAIYIVRDPRDVLLSGQNHFNLNSKQMLDFMVDENSKLIRTEGSVPEWLGEWTNHVRSWVDLFPKKKIIFRYEDMLANPMEAFSKVAMELGITQDKKRIERAIEFSSFKKMKSMESEEGFAEKPQHTSTFFRSGKSDEWRDRLTKAEIKTIQTHHGEIMKRFGYELV